MNSVTTKDRKRSEAEARNAAWAALSFEDQLASLDKTFGKGNGAAKQRAKIASKISARDAAVKTGATKGKAKKGK